MSDAKRVYTRFIEEVINKGNLKLCDELISPTYRVHNPGLVPGQDPSGPNGMRQLVGAIRTAFPDCKITVDTLVGEKDRVFSSWIAEGTHQGALMGLPPTNKAIRVRGSGITSVHNGKMETSTDKWDLLELLMQLGLGPKVDKRKTLSRRLIEEIWNHSNFGVLDQLVEDVQDRERHRRHAKEIHAAFPDIHVSVIDQVEEGDMVATSWIATGTHEGMFMGVPPTGRKIDAHGINVDRVADGKLNSSKTDFDTWDVLRQLGVRPG